MFDEKITHEDKKTLDEKSPKAVETEKEESQKQKNFRLVLIYAAIIVLAAIRALGTFMFLVPNGFAPGGVAGVATIIYNIVMPFYPKLAELWFNPALTFFVMNIPLFIVAFMKLEKRFVVRSLVGALTYTVFMALFSIVKLPTFQGSSYESGIMLLGAIAGGVVCGFGLGFMLKLNTCLGGTDIVGKLIHKKNPFAAVQWIIFMLDCSVVLCSGFIGTVGLTADMTTTQVMIRILSPILYSFIALFTTSKVAEIITTGLESSAVFQIITERPNEIAEEIIKKMHRGVTILNGEGYFSHKERKILICVAHKRQVSHIKNIIKTFDPNAFVYIMSAKQVTGKGFMINSGE